MVKVMRIFFVSSSGGTQQFIKSFLFIPPYSPNLSLCLLPQINCRFRLVAALTRQKYKHSDDHITYLEPEYPTIVNLDDLSRRGLMLCQTFVPPYCCSAPTHRSRLHYYFYSFLRNNKIISVQPLLAYQPRICAI